MKNQESNVLRFYKWLEMCNNKYRNVPELMIPAIRKVALNSK